MADVILKLPKNNLYANGTITKFTEGDMMLDAAPYKTPQQPKFSVHLCTEADELTALAYKYYGNTVADASKYWHVIAKANEILRPWDLSDYIGKQIIIPDIIQYLANNT